VNWFPDVPVDFGDKFSESAASREAVKVKLFAKSGGANKPRCQPTNNLQQ
jgi:hypothetical protein